MLWIVCIQTKIITIQDACRLHEIGQRISFYGFFAAPPDHLVETWFRVGEVATFRTAALVARPVIHIQAGGELVLWDVNTDALPEKLSHCHLWIWLHLDSFKGLILILDYSQIFFDFTLIGHCIAQWRASILCPDSKDFKRRTVNLLNTIWHRAHLVSHLLVLHGHNL